MVTYGMYCTSKAMGTRARIKRSAERVYAVSGKQAVYRTERRMVATGLMVAAITLVSTRNVVATPQEVYDHQSVAKMFKPQYV